jgi:hypothetical protein
MLHVSSWWRREMCIECWWEILKGKVHLEDLGVDETVLKWILKICDGREWSGFI